MRRIVTDERVARFVGNRVENLIYPPFTAMGVEEDGEIVAGVVFNSFTGHDIEVTVAGKAGAFTRGFIRQVGRYVFQQAKCLRLSITTCDPRVMDIARRLGARGEGCKRHFFGRNRDGMLFGLLREDWKV